MSINNNPILIFFIYAFNSPHERQSLWKEISIINRDVRSPWAMIGDFNGIASPNEKLNRASVTLKDIEEIQNLFLSNHPSDLKRIGSFFSWSDKHQPLKRIHCKLDRALVNNLWLDVFPHFFADFVPLGLSDHSPITLYINKSPRVFSPFRFCNFWSDHSDFPKVIQESWGSFKGCNSLGNLHKKLQRSKAALKFRFSKMTTSLRQQVQFTKQELSVIQS
eukprot:TRINITY_DN8421_c0_g1_i1.p1 TRINITY_DN8421_c0_g1~~TRINITY_DN8421_c0_g1_i1.p1  ORF type:complete len:245 (-),score=11.43 TRINITY_DN8421_c0_g1_i1:798-1457(-)